MKHFIVNFKNAPQPGESIELFDDIEDDSELKAAAQLAWNDKDDEAAN